MTHSTSTWASNSPPKTTHDAEDDPRNQDIKIYVDGDLVHRDEAKISVYDSGFLLGDGMWEGMRLHNGKWAFFDAHMDRLFDGLKAASIKLAMDRLEILDALNLTAAANGMTDNAHCRLMVTRGIKVRPFQHPSLSRSGPTVVIIIEHSKPAKTVEPNGIRLATVPQIRGLPMSQDAKLNSHSKLNCVLACLQAEQAGVDEGLMLDPHGFVNTTNACNFFIVRKGEVWTSTGDYCLNGVTRQNVIDLCLANGIPVSERNYSLVETYSADEAFLTGSFGGQTPVGEIDGHLIGDGSLPGPITRELQSLYKDLITKNTA